MLIKNWSEILLYMKNMLNKNIFYWKGLRRVVGKTNKKYILLKLFIDDKECFRIRFALELAYLDSFRS